MNGRDSLIEVKNLRIHFNVRDGVVKAVDGLNFEIKRGQTVGIIGESGCGKSIAAKAVMHMVPKPGKIVEGEIIFHRKTSQNGKGEQIEAVRIDKLDPDGDVIRRIRGGHIAMIFQEPMSSLTPVYTAGFHIMEAVSLHRFLPIETIGQTMTKNIQQKRGVDEAEARQIAVEMLRKVGIPRPQSRVDSYPHQLSGGQRQRVMIAIALSTHPDLLIADEPTTALDVSIEAQILDLMRELQQTVDMSIMFITHNMGVVAEMADEIIVMYMGKEVERAKTIDLFDDPKHPYTQALLASIPQIGEKTDKDLATIKGMVPDPFHLPSGCVFHPRCPDFMRGKCDRIAPKLGEEAPGHWVRCLLYDASWPDTPEAQLIKTARPRPVPVTPEAAGAQAANPTRAVPAPVAVSVAEQIIEPAMPAPVQTATPPDDLQKIEGIGPRIAALLQEAGVTTFAQLANTEVGQLQEILQKAGSRFQMADPSSWPQQAELAAAGKWAEFETLQRQLTSGRRREEER
jgi:oligopeptide/dipeptide ABC transporter ATP-binding protein